MSAGATTTAAAEPRWLAAGDPCFPPLLRNVPHAPPGLWVRSLQDGPALLEKVWGAPAVAIVGTRAASAAGCDLARTLAWGLARAGVVIVSGLARGIDGAAHDGALLAGGRTAAVMGCGLDTCYPLEHSRMAAEIERSGALVSEWPVGTPPAGWRFPRRNRLISGLAHVLVVVEAEARSGAWHTVRFACDQGREVMAVPRDPLHPGSVGPNRLIRDGAPPVLDAADVLRVLEEMPHPVTTPAAAPADPGRLRPPGSREGTEPAGELTTRILRHLMPGCALAVDELASRLPEVETGELLAAIVALEVEGRVRRDESGRLRVQAGA